MENFAKRSGFGGEALEKEKVPKNLPKLHVFVEKYQ
jgi:hypothetical protein